jgi:hypothetical protein
MIAGILCCLLMVIALGYALKSVIINLSNNKD